MYYFNEYIIKSPNLYKTIKLNFLMARGRISPDFLVATVLALSPSLSQSVKNGMLSEEYLKGRMLHSHSKVLEYAGIRPHQLHGDSLVLDDAITSLVSRGLLLRSTGSDDLRWGSIVSPQEYYESEITPTLSPNLRKEVSYFARNLN